MNLKNLNSGGRERIELTEFVGIDAYNNSTRLKDGYFQEALNVDVSVARSEGILVKRVGLGKYNTVVVEANKEIINLIEFSTATTRYLIAKTVNGTSSKLRYVTGDPSSIDYLTSWTDISAVENAERQQYEFYKNKLYVFNRSYGATDNRVWNGTNFTEHGCPPLWMGDVTVATEPNGSMGAGTYYYLIRFIYDNYQPSGILMEQPSESNNYLTVTASQQVNITLPTTPFNTVANARITGREIYRTKTTDTENYYFVCLVPNNADTSYFDNKPDSELGDSFTPYELAQVKKPYQSKYGIVHKGKMWQANLRENFVHPFTIANITLTGSNAGGSMTAGVYKYRFYKQWTYETGGITFYENSQVYEVSITLTVGQNRVVIANPTGRDNWNSGILIMRTKVGGSKFYYHAFAPITMATGFPFADTYADADLEVDFPLNDVRGDLYLPSTVTFGEDLLPDVPNKLSDRAIGDDNSKITGLFSERDRVVIFKEDSIHAVYTTQLSEDFWQTELLSKGVGAYTSSTTREPVICQLPNNEYLFSHTKNAANKSPEVLIYHWNGGFGSEPRECSQKIKPYLTSALGFYINDMKYDAEVNKVYVTMFNLSGTAWYILVYNLNILDEKGNGTWMIYDSGTDSSTMFFSGMAKTRENELLLGYTNGFVYMLNKNSNTDLLTTAYSNVPIKVRLKTRLFDFYDVRINLVRILLIVDAGASGASNLLSVFYAKDDGSETTTTYTLTSGRNKINLPLNVLCNRFYVGLENTDNISLKIHYMAVDIKRLHEVSSKP